MPCIDINSTEKNGIPTAKEEDAISEAIQLSR